MRMLSLLTVLTVTGCGACKTTPGAEVAPKDLAEKGVVLDGPEDGSAVKGRWISVLGWFDPTEIAFVSVLGAPVDGFYEPTGHVGVPSVTVTFRKDGRFFAPRGPVEEGSNRITVIGLSRQMRPLAPIHHCQGRAAAVPMEARRRTATPGLPCGGSATTVAGTELTSVAVTLRWRHPGHR